MGSTGCYREPGQTDIEFFTRELIGDDGGELLAGVTMPLGDFDWSHVFYAAWKLGPRHGDEAGDVVALVVMLKRIPRSSDGCNFYYKAITEQMGPADDTCPERILKLLTPTENEYATEWRQKCWDNVAKAKAKPKPKKGDRIRFAEPLEFTDGSTCQEFVLVERSTFRRAEGYGLVRISSWRSRNFEVVAA